MDASRLGKVFAVVAVAPALWSCDSIESDRTKVSGCSKAGWHSTVNLGSPVSEIASAVLTGTMRDGCPAVTFACSSGSPSFEISIVNPRAPVARVGPLVMDRILMNLPTPQADRSVVRITDRRQVEIAAYVIGKALSVRAEVEFTEGPPGFAEFSPYDAEIALNPVLLACGLHRLAAPETSEPDSYDDRDNDDRR